MYIVYTDFGNLIMYDVNEQNIIEQIFYFRTNTKYIVTLQYIYTFVTFGICHTAIIRMLVLEIIIVCVYFLKKTTKHTRARTHTCAYTHTYTHMCTRTHTHTYTCANNDNNIHSLSHTHARTRTHMRTHAHIHAHTHT